MDFQFQMPDKKSLCFLAIVAAVAFIIGAVFLIYSLMAVPVIDNEEIYQKLKQQQQQKAKKQLKELQQIGGDIKPLSQEEISKQLEELKKLGGEIKK